MDHYEQYEEEAEKLRKLIEEYSPDLAEVQCAINAYTAARDLHASAPRSERESVIPSFSFSTSSGAQV